MDFAELYGRYARDVYRFALFLCADQALAEDVTAETFARALGSRQPIRVDTVKAYLLAIARNLCRDSAGSSKRFLPLPDGVVDRVDPAPLPDAAAGDRQQLAAVLAAVQRLPDAERQALVLAVDGDLGYRTIAAILGCSEAAVKVRVHRARLRLRSLLGEEELVP